MPETTKMHVPIWVYDAVTAYKDKLEKEHGVKVPLVAAMEALIRAGYKSKTGKDYKPKR